jgi:ABC-type multidrug transport system fused ATPase/permease subunit
MEIPATYKIALVGASGCGKSTIANMLLRFYNPDSGKIMIDDKNICDYSVQDLRRQIGFVMQEPILFNKSIKDNILYGKTNATDAEIRRVCEQANALQFIESAIEELD